MFVHERKIWRTGVYYVAGVDEAGRGPLAGPVVAAAVVVAPGLSVEGVDDSKRLAAAARERLFEEIRAAAPAVGVGIADHEEIDRFNILQATFLAMRRAVRALPVTPGHLLIDGNRFADRSPADDGDRVEIPYTTLVGGDGASFAIGAASIVAKVARDRIMVRFDSLYPGYGFARHKGYPTPQHIAAIARLGRCPIHRRSFTVRGQFAFPFGE